MAIVSRTVLKSYFEDGKEPDEAKYIDLIDTMALSGDIITDHGALTGKGDDDHPQYLLASGTRVCTGSFYVNDAIYVTNGGIFVHGSGSGLASTIGGLEMEWDGTQSDLLSYKRSTSQYRKLRFRASEHAMLVGTTVRLTLNTSGEFIYTGNSAISGGLYLGSAATVTTAGRLKMTDHLYIAKGVTLGYVNGAANADGVNIYVGTTLRGEIYADSGWFRFGQNTGINNYTPQYWYGAAGLRAGSAAPAPVGGDITFADRIIKDHGGSDKSGNIFVQLNQHIPSINHWGTARSTSSGNETRTVSTEFPGVPASVRAIALRIHARDSATHPQTGLYLQVGYRDLTNQREHLAVHPGGSDMFAAAQGVVPVYNNTIVIRWQASGVNLMDTWLTCVGYYI